MEELPGSEFEMQADLVLLALGFLGPVQGGLVDDLGLKLDPRGNVEAQLNDYHTSEPGVFAAGDCRRGQSLVVWAQWVHITDWLGASTCSIIQTEHT